jgi:hypothetical protein
MGMADFLGIVAGTLAIGRAIYPAPIGWGRKPWFVKNDRQGRIALAAFGGLFLLLALGHAVS